MSAAILPECLPTEKVCAEARRLLGGVERGLKSRRNRDGVCSQVTDLYLCVQTLAMRAGNGENFDGGGGGGGSRSADGDSGMGGFRGMERWDTRTGDPMLAAAVDEDGEYLEDGGDDDWAAVGFEADGNHRPIPMVELLGGDGDADEREVAVAEGFYDVEDWRMLHFGELLRYLVRGSREVDEVSRRVLAICRKVMPDQLRAFAGSKPSQAAIARKAKRGGEERATTCAREHREVEKIMKDAGLLGWKGLGGAKSEAHRENCRQAQLVSQGRNGSNRRRGHLARSGERGAEVGAGSEDRGSRAALGAETMPDVTKLEGRVFGSGE